MSFTLEYYVTCVAFFFIAVVDVGGCFGASLTMQYKHIMQVPAAAASTG